MSKEKHRKPVKSFMPFDENKQSLMTLKAEEFESFMTACDKAKRPNAALQDALFFTQSKGIK